MKAYVHSNCIRPDGQKDTFRTDIVESGVVHYVQKKFSYRIVFWQGRWRKVHHKLGRCSCVDGMPIVLHFLRFRAGSGIEATVSFEEI